MKFVDVWTLRKVRCAKKTKNSAYDLSFFMNAEREMTEKLHLWQKICFNKRSEKSTVVPEKLQLKVDLVTKKHLEVGSTYINLGIN